VVTLPVQEPVGAGDGAAFRVRYQIDPNAFLVVFLGRLDEKKGLDLLVEAVSRLAPSHPELRLAIVGSGEPRYEGELKSIVRRAGVTAEVIMCGFLSGADKQGAYAAGDVFALPSRNENFGIAVVEAMYAGLALLLSHEVYTAEVPRRAGAAEMCEPTADSCEAALRRLLGRRGELAAMGARAHAAAVEHFAPGVATRHLIDVYDEIQREKVSATAVARG
jgi:glycosyltransferase involved in cell wall biosynthesis